MKVPRKCPTSVPNVRYVSDTCPKSIPNMSETRPQSIRQMSDTCPKHVRKTCLPTHVGNTCPEDTWRIWFGHVSDMFGTRFVDVSYMFRTCFGHVFRTCFGHVSDMFGTLFGPVVRTCFFEKCPKDVGKVSAKYLKSARKGSKAVEKASLEAICCSRDSFRPPRFWMSSSEKDRGCDNRKTHKHAYKLHVHNVRKKYIETTNAPVIY
jgi:hypothetical protein